MRYAVVNEKGERNYSAYVPELPGCVSVGDTLEEVKAEISPARRRPRAACAQARRRCEQEAPLSRASGSTLEDRGPP